VRRPLAGLAVVSACLALNAAAAHAAGGDAVRETAVAQAADAAPSLTLGEVLTSAEQTFPMLEAARQETDAAAGEALAAEGAFDLRLQASAETLRGTGYENDRGSFVLQQPLTFGGASIFGGYRLGRGIFAPYDGKAQTLTDGEWKAGVSLPLLRDRAIDSRRAGVARTALGVEAATYRADGARLRVLADAATRYWDWVAAGHQLVVASSLLAIAEARDRDLGTAVSLGAIAPVERLDNQRSILQRRSGVIAATRAFERHALALSLYLRGPDGTPRMPSVTQVPPSTLSVPPPPDAATVEADVVRALDARPEVRSLLIGRAQQDVALELARNEALPSLEIFGEVARDRGAGSASLRGTEVDAGASFMLPMQRRQARGQTRAALAARARIDAELRLARDRVRVEVEDALSAWRAAAASLDLIRQELDAARALEQAERDRFVLGESTQFLVNLRELATAEGAFREIAAVAEGLKASVAYDAATARPPRPQP